LHFLIPREASATTATLWIAAVDEPQAAQQLQLAPGTPGTVTYQPWEKWPLNAQKPRIRHREVRVSGLQPRQTYSFTLQSNGNDVASAKVTTLPTALPLLGEKPFTVLLGSCFARLEDEGGRVANTFFHLPHSARPDVKFLAGDQVYLDSPASAFTRPHSVSELHEGFVRHYTATWGDPKGLATLLSEGANFFSSDDHEYWNNAPNRAVHIPDTYLGNLDAWLKAARELYRAFQTPKTITEFTVPPVSFLIADTRINRSADESDFMKAADLLRVEQWVKALKGPGVLVIGQPLLQTTTNVFSGTLFDWNLPDYKQYHALVEIVGASPHSLVILTGDVHFGRVARSTLRSDKDLVEIISSPLSLVDEVARGKWEKAPAYFPTTRPATVTPAWLARSGVVTEDFAPTEGHFLTIEFTRRGSGAHLRLRFWPVITNGVPSSEFGKTVWERGLA
jgi:hypothetical protein